MRQRRRLVAATGAALALAFLLTGCPAGGDVAGPRTGAPAVPPTTAPADAAPSATSAASPAAPEPPLTSLRSTVDLSSAAPGPGAVASVAVGAPGGGAFVVLTPSDRDDPPRLATVAPVGDGFAVSRSVELPLLFPVWDVHALPDGDVLVSGRIPGGTTPGYGFAVVDPATGRSRLSVVVPSADATEVSDGRTALAPDGATLYLFVGTYPGDAPQLNLLVTADVVSGRLLSGRDLFAEVRDVSLTPISPFSTWLFARPRGGADLLFDAYAPGQRWLRPTLLRYDDALEPVDRPVPLVRAGGQAQLQAATATPDGTVYVSAEVSAGQLLTAVEPGGTSGTLLLELPGRTYDYALAVEPARRWALLPAARGARAVDLATGGANEIDVGCASSRPVRQIVPAETGALLLGQCDDVPLLWMTDL